MSESIGNKPPFDENAEIAVLGSMVLDNGSIPVVRGALGPEDFYVSANRQIYETVLHMCDSGKPVDVALLSAALRERGILAEVGGDTHLMVLAESVPSAANAEHYARLIRSASRKRKMLMLTQDIQKGIADGADEERLAALVKQLHGVSVADGAGGSDVVCLADVEPEPLQWLWPGRVPLGKLTLLVGDPGLGKSCVTLDIAARVSRGRPWPDAPGMPGRIGSVVVLSAEDDVADTILPRLLAAGGNVERVHVLQSVRERTGRGQAGNRMFDLARDLPYMEDVLQTVGDVLMVVIDPLSAYMPSVDSHVNSEVRSVLGPLAALAAKHGVSVLGVSHLNKGAGTSAAYRVTGSIAFTAAAWAVWCTAKDKDNPSRRLFLPMKCNLAPDQSGLAFALAETPDHPGIPTVAWERDAVTMNLDDALAVPRGPGHDSAVEEAGEWLREVLAEGPVSSKDLRRMGRENGHSWRTIRRAKDHVGIVIEREGFGAEIRSMWSLAAQSCPNPPPFVSIGQNWVEALETGLSCPSVHSWPMDTNGGHECSDDPDERAAIVAEGGGDK